MVYQYRVTLTGIKGFFRLYCMRPETTLYTFHKQMRADMEFAQDQLILFKALDAAGNVVARYGQFGAYIQKGEGDGRQYASLASGQLIETITIPEAIKLFDLPRTVGKYLDMDIVATKGRFGPYLKWNGRNFSIPRGKDPLKISLEECAAIIADQKDKGAAAPAIAEFKESGIQVINGRYGPYIKHAGNNYRIPKGTDPATLTEEDCRKLIAGNGAAGRGKYGGRYSRKK